jgi:hypothetical protein
MSYRYYSCVDQRVTVTDSVTKASRETTVGAVCATLNDEVSNDGWHPVMTIGWMLTDPCSALFMDSLIRDRENETEQAKRDRRARRKLKEETDRERRAVKYGARP